MTLGNKLKRYRQEYKFTQDMVATFCGVSRQAVAKWEKGVSNPEVENLVQLAEVYHISLDMLLAGKDFVPSGGMNQQGDTLAENEKLLNKGLQQAMACEDPDKEIQTFIEYIGRMMCCDRTYIFEQDPCCDYCNTYEWCNRGVESKILQLQGVPTADFGGWMDSFQRGEYIFIEKVESLKVIDPKLYAWVSQKQIESLLAFPLFDGKGFFGVDNPARAFVNQTVTLLEMSEHFIESMLQRRDMVQNLLMENDRRKELDKAAHRARYYANLETGKIVLNMEYLQGLGYDFEIESMEELEQLLEGHTECRNHILEDGLGRVQRVRKATTIEFVFYTHDHLIHWARLGIRPFLDNEGNLLHLYGYLQDISGEHEIIERYNAFTSHLNGGMHICYLSDPCHLYYASDNLCHLVGYSREEFDEIVGDSYDSLIVDEDYLTFKGFVKRLTENPGTSETCEYGLKHRDGSVVRVMDTMESVLDGNGIVYGYANVMDVSEMRDMLDSAKEAEMKQMAELDKQFEIVDALSRDYRNIFVVDMEKEQAVIHKLNGYVTRGMDRQSLEPISYMDYYRRYIEDRVYPDDQPMMLELMHPDHVRKKLQDKDYYISSYRILENGEIHYCQFKYLILNKEEMQRGEPMEVIAAFKNIDQLYDDTI